ncbi:MAG: hypothetical protein BroJett040_02280 [Oligoflexia bacterium]|nr:MAG: hypothetical protein BroJett040_02280 [Oligoflexia bacterium]
MKTHGELKQEIHNQGFTAISLIYIWLIAVLFWWAFAFYRVPSDAPSWLAQAQVACFGTNSSGLPASYGWMLLVLAPLMLMLFILVGYSTEIKHIPTLIQKSRTHQIGFLIFLCLTFWEATWVTARIKTGLAIANVSYEPKDMGALPEGYPRTHKTLPDFSLINHRGETITKENLKHKRTILTFVFAHCSTVCPTLVKESLRAQQQADGDDVWSVFITVDPWRDTPSSLPTLALVWKLPHQSHLLSGDIQSVQETLQKLEMPTQRDEKTGDIGHPALVYVLDREGQIAYTFNNPTVQWLTEALERLD